MDTNTNTPIKDNNTDWANCVSCNKNKKEIGDEELILLPCFHFICVGPCFNGILANNSK